MRQHQSSNGARPSKYTTEGSNQAMMSGLTAKRRLSESRKSVRLVKQRAMPNIVPEFNRNCKNSKSPLNIS